MSTARFLSVVDAHVCADGPAIQPAARVTLEGDVAAVQAIIALIGFQKTGHIVASPTGLELRPGGIEVFCPGSR